MAGRCLSAGGGPILVIYLSQCNIPSNIWFRSCVDSYCFKSQCLMSISDSKISPWMNGVVRVGLIRWRNKSLNGLGPINEIKLNSVVGVMTGTWDGLRKTNRTKWMWERKEEVLRWYHGQSQLKWCWRLITCTSIEFRSSIIIMERAGIMVLIAIIADNVCNDSPLIFRRVNYWTTIVDEVYIRCVLISI